MPAAVLHWLPITVARSRGCQKIRGRLVAVCMCHSCCVAAALRLLPFGSLLRKLSVDGICCSPDHYHSKKTLTIESDP
jgi:hypothetical protein